MSDSEDHERIQIRAELSSMSFEDLQKLKEKLGSKVYNEAVFGVNSKKETNRKKQEEFKRENKNRPREMSSKKPVSMLNDVKASTEKEVRDPRFDSMCGTYNAKAFKRSYNFLTDIKKSELGTLKKELKQTVDEERKEQIKYLIQRLENQFREEVKHKKIFEKKQVEISEKADMMKKGIAPDYIKKSDKKLLSLMDQYTELKSSGKLEKHIAKHRKKNSQKIKKRKTVM